MRLTSILQTICAGIFAAIWTAGAVRNMRSRNPARSNVEAGKASSSGPGKAAAGEPKTAAAAPAKDKGAKQTETVPTEAKGAKPSTPLIAKRSVTPVPGTAASASPLAAASQPIRTATWRLSRGSWRVC